MHFIHQIRFKKNSHSHLGSLRWVSRNDTKKKLIKRNELTLLYLNWKRTSNSLLLQWKTQKEGTIILPIYLYLYYFTYITNHRIPKPWTYNTV